MNDYLQTIVTRQRTSELLREAADERLARRARVRRDGHVSLARKLGAGVRAALGQVAPAAPSGRAHAHVSSMP